MERLTKRVGVDEAVPICDFDICVPFQRAGKCKTGTQNFPFGGWERHCNDTCILGRMIDRLAAYEDTGLMPEQVASQRWIPVSERLPEAGIEVLAMLQVNKFDGHDAHNVTTAVLMPSESWLVADYQEGIMAETSGTDCEDCCYWITHWMPLPEPPKVN